MGKGGIVLMYTNLIKELEKRGINLFHLSKILKIRYRDLVDKLNGRKAFTNEEIKNIFDLISDKGSDDYFEYLFSNLHIYN